MACFLDLGAVVERAEILSEAAKLIEGERDKVYGSPRENHERIATLWSTFLGVPIHPAQVAICMALVKISRLTASLDHDDSFVDAVGYLAIAGELKPSERQSEPDKSESIRKPHLPLYEVEKKRCQCC